jgi:hypothetical protein
MTDVVTTHEWVGAAYVALNKPEAKYAARRGSIRVAEKTRVEVLDVYCTNCRLPYDDAKDVVCTLTHHLRGGPIGVRTKRGPQGGPRDAKPPGSVRCAS